MGTRKITLGEKTTMISTVALKDNNKAIGIAFTNIREDFHKPDDGQDVFIEILNMQGVISYIKPIFELLISWGVKDKNILTQCLKEINLYLNIDNE